MMFMSTVLRVLQLLPRLIRFKMKRFDIFFSIFGRTSQAVQFDFDQFSIEASCFLFFSSYHLSHS